MLANIVLDFIRYDIMPTLSGNNITSIAGVIPTLLGNNVTSVVGILLKITSPIFLYHKPLANIDIDSVKNKYVWSFM